LPRVVAFAWALHLDHIGTVITKQLTCPWTGKDAAHIEYANFFQSG
jgi:hypothetical protein